MEGILTDEEVEERPVITSQTDNILIEIVFTQLNAEVLFESKPENYGISNFIKAKETMALLVWFFIFKETMLCLCKAIDYIWRQMPTSSLPNKLAGYLFGH